MKKIQKMEMKKKKRGKGRGITLIALVVTIIVLIILAGIAIVTTFGEDGLIAKTKQAEYETIKKEMQTELKLLRAEKFIQKKAESEEYTLEEYKDDILNDDSRGNKLKYTYDSAEIVDDTLHVTSGKYRFDIITGDDLEESLPPDITRFYLEFDKLEENPETIATMREYQPLGTLFNNYKAYIAIPIEHNSTTQDEIQKMLETITIKDVKQSEIEMVNGHSAPRGIYSEIDSRFETIEKNTARWNGVPGKKVVVYKFDSTYYICFIEGKNATIDVKYPDTDVQGRKIYKKYDTFLEIKKIGNLFNTQHMDETSIEHYDIPVNKISDKLPKHTIYAKGQRKKFYLNASHYEHQTVNFRNRHVSQLEIASNFLENAPTLKNIEIISGPLKSYKFLEHIKDNVTYINVGSYADETKKPHWKLEDISGIITNMPKLQTLRVGAKIKDLNVFKNLPEIRVVGLGKSNISENEREKIEIPVDAFSNNTKLTTAKNLFDGSIIENIPPGLFINTKLGHYGAVQRLFEGATIRGARPEPSEILPDEGAQRSNKEQLYAGATLVD